MGSLRPPGEPRLELHPTPSRKQDIRSQLAKTAKGSIEASQASGAQTIFHEPWWLEAASKGTYQEATVAAGGKIIARLPYIVTKAAGFKMIGMPLMTHVLGPVLMAETRAANCTHAMNYVAITSELISQLPKAAHISFRLHGGASSTLAFDAAGFQNGVHFTVEIPPDAPDLQWRQMRDKTRNVIRRSQEKLSIAEFHDPAQFMDFYEQNLGEQGARNFYDRSVCETLMAGCLARGAGRILVAVNHGGNFEAAVFTVWDKTTEYYFMSSRSRDSMNGAVSCLIWAAIQHASSKGLTFDMDCVHVKGKQLPNLLLLTGFGGSMKPRYSVRKTSLAGNVARYVRGVLS